MTSNVSSIFTEPGKRQTLAFASGQGLAYPRGWCSVLVMSHAPLERAVVCGDTLRSPHMFGDARGVVFGSCPSCLLSSGGVMYGGVARNHYAGEQGR